ncbi:MAG: M24 family metallopeptidase [Chloroflexi bacterium]|nr:M24 family metallopeptidase [Chloroflexota bacterium]
MTTTQPTRADRLLSKRGDRIADELDQVSADGWLVYDFHGSNPAFSRLLGSPGELMSTRRAFLYIPRVGDPRLLIHHVDAGNLSRLGLDVRPYGGRDELLQALALLLGGARRVLMEYSPGNAIPYVSRVDGGTLDLVRSFGIEVLSSADALAAVVAAWDSADIASHQRAADALDLCKDGLFSGMQSRLGMGVEWNELEAQQHLVRLMQEHGLEFDHAPIVAVNRHAGDPHYAPVADKSLPIKPGDLVLCDVWGREKERPDGGVGTYADITWVASAADPIPGDHVRIWEIVRSARDAAVSYIEDQVDAGEPVQGGQVDRVARGVIDKAGYGKAFTHRTGHSIGWLGAHGDGVNIDDFETHDTRLLRPGAAFSIEPGIYLSSFGVRSEINVVITPGNQVKVTTRRQTDLVKLV